MPESITVTVAPGRSLVLSVKWADASGAEHAADLIRREGETASVPAPMARTLRAEGIVL